MLEIVQGNKEKGKGWSTDTETWNTESDYVDSEDEGKSSLVYCCTATISDIIYAMLSLLMNLSYC